MLADKALAELRRHARFKQLVHKYRLRQQAQHCSRTTAYHRGRSPDRAGRPDGKIRTELHITPQLLTITRRYR